MQPWAFILVNIAIAAFVGGLTNHFAIKMLFHPREAVRLLGRRVPFTPGLIPKRKAQIADSLGEVVASYLVTSEGLKELLGRTSFRDAAMTRIRARLLAAAAEEPGLTPGGLAARYWGEEGLEAKRREWSDALLAFTGDALERLWIERGWSGRTLAELVPGWSPERLESWSGKAETIITDALRKELLSPRGQQMLRKLATGLLDRAGGLLGALAGIFMDEDKMLAKLTPVLVEQLGGEAVRAAIRGMIARQLQQAGDWTLEETVARLSGDEEPLPWLQAKLEALLRPEERLRRLESFDISGWLRDNELRWERWLDSLLAASLGMLERNMESIVAAIGLPKLVKEQVEKFPIERLEQVILSVSGKEFKAITWLGALLGGMIGLTQSLFLIWLQ